MTGYRYKWVSTVLCGEPDKAAAEKAIKAGWKPATVIPPEIKPLTGMTMEQTLRGMALYCMPEEIVVAREQKRHQENLIEQDPRTHVARANEAVQEHIAALNKEHGRTDAGKGWSPIVGNGTTVVGSKPVWTPATRDWKS